MAISPFVGRLIDRYGSGIILAVTSLVVGSCAFGLSLVGQAWAFYALYVPGRMAFASPLELGTNTAVNNWFIRRRPLALALLTVNQGIGLAAMPLVAQFIISGWNWRVAWVSLGIYTLAVGVLPALLLVARRPEDMGLAADPRPGEPRSLSSQASTSPAKRNQAAAAPEAGDAAEAASRETATEAAALPLEGSYTVRRALRTRAFWVLAIFSGAGFMVQAGVSLHQVSHFINQGLDDSAAAFSAGVFAFCQVLGGLLLVEPDGQDSHPLSAGCGGLLRVRRRGRRGSQFNPHLGTAGGGCPGRRRGWAASAVAVGLGRVLRAGTPGQHTGLTLPVQVGGQALGPVIAGFLYDYTDSYQLPFRIFSAAVFLAGLLVLTGDTAITN